MLCAADKDPNTVICKNRGLPHLTFQCGGPCCIFIGLFVVFLVFVVLIRAVDTAHAGITRILAEIDLKAGAAVGAAQIVAVQHILIYAHDFAALGADDLVLVLLKIVLVVVIIVVFVELEIILSFVPSNDFIIGVFISIKISICFIFI